jgi:chemotaxis protein histidine kinase CheA
MGDGTVALILDILGVARHAGLLVRRQSTAERAHSTITRPSASSANLLVCLVGRRRIGLPLVEVTRLTSVARCEIEAAGQNEVLHETTSCCVWFGLTSCLANLQA